MKNEEKGNDSVGRIHARMLSRLLTRALNLMGHISLEKLNSHTLIMLYNVTVDFPNFIRAFNGKVKAVLDNRKEL